VVASPRAGVEFRILGPLEVVDRGRIVPLGGPRQRALLPVLLTRANEVVSTDRLMDELWGERAPRTAANSMQYHVSQLRKALAPSEPIVTREPGYLIQVGPDELDLFRFERLVDQARARRPPSRPGCSARRSDSGVAWRSPISSTSRLPKPRSGVSRSFASPPSSDESRPIFKWGLMRTWSPSWSRLSASTHSANSSERS
jgi:hypothetical protein